MPLEHVQIPKVSKTHRGSAGWFPVERAAQGRPPRVRVICGGCGKFHLTLSDHAIFKDGTVHPSLLCPDDDCGWHVFGKLQDWNPDNEAGI